ncbi:sigma factor-like helix-turn-helix DNA-binding protein [Brevibacillus choshinensis]|uniref:sigma factor-like helix-turn-helix DNA-binding protein n=1 Tax=Brevibacillus choshinensis TaxID=54911 RepID=UPI002E1A7E38|nr:sigma factor-like helix-turn-helix DNA-binding protein [Brevibacillus choshinensis]MED4581861.1 sigma factor-like helix-turn-helix DNA-binding protein [Brevibacillus choshinensis]
MQELLNGYKETRKALEQIQRSLKDFDDAIRVVRLEEARRKTGKAKSTCNGDENKPERQIIGEMIGDTEFVIEWIESGRRPGNKRGIERRAAYERERLMDPVRMQAFVSRSTAGSPCNLTEWQRFQLADALSSLTERERECFVLTHGEGFSFEETARLLQITKSSVQTFVTRAQAKISEQVSNSLFLIG